MIGRGLSAQKPSDSIELSPGVTWNYVANPSDQTIFVFFRHEWAHAVLRTSTMRIVSLWTETFAKILSLKWDAWCHRVRSFSRSIITARDASIFLNLETIRMMTQKQMFDIRICAATMRDAIVSAKKPSSAHFRRWRWAPRVCLTFQRLSSSSFLRAIFNRRRLYHFAAWNLTAKTSIIERHDMDFTPMDHLIPLNQEFVISICRDPHDVHLAIKESSPWIVKKKQNTENSSSINIIVWHNLWHHWINRLMFNQNSSEKCLFNWWHSRFTLPIKFHCVKRELICEHLLSSRVQAQFSRCCLLASKKNFYRRGSFQDKNGGKKRFFYCTGIFEVNIERRNFICSPKRLSSLEKSARAGIISQDCLIYAETDYWLIAKRGKVDRGLDEKHFTNEDNKRESAEQIKPSKASAHIFNR